MVILPTFKQNRKKLFTHLKPTKAEDIDFLKKCEKFHLDNWRIPKMFLFSLRLNYELTSPKYQECTTIPTLSGKLWKESHTRAYWLIDGYLSFNKVKETPFQIKSNLFHQDSSSSKVTAGMRMINSISEKNKI